MSAERLREAAAAVREDCPIPERSRGNDFIDFPTGFAIQGVGVEHVEKCSAAQTSGAMLCDCEAIYPAWRRWRTLLAVADWLDETAEFFNPNSAIWGRALAVASAYLGEQ